MVLLLVILVHIYALINADNGRNSSVLPIAYIYAKLLLNNISDSKYHPVGFNPASC